MFTISELDEDCKNWANLKILNYEVIFELANFYLLFSIFNFNHIYT